jgi:hypothetical protein
MVAGEHFVFRARDGSHRQLRIPPEVWREDEDFDHLYGGDYGRWLVHAIGMHEDTDAFDLEALAEELERDVEEHRPMWREVQEHHARTAELGRRAEVFPGRTALELLNEVEPERDELVPGLIVRGGVTLVGGREKLSGKSTLMFYLAGAMERSEATAFGEPYREPVRTIFLTEEPAYAIRDKVERFGLRDGRVVYGWEVPATSGDGAHQRWQERVTHIGTLAQEGGFGHMVVDPFSRLAEVENESGREPGERAEFVSNIAQQFGLAITLVHHNNKSGGRMEDLFRGSTSLPAAVDQMVQIGYKAKASNVRDLASWARVETGSWERSIELSEDGTTYMAIERSSAPSADENQLDYATRIAGSVEGERDMKTNDIADGLGSKSTSRTFKAALGRAIQDGLIVQLKQGHYGDPALQDGPDGARAEGRRTKAAKAQ